MKRLIQDDLVKFLFIQNFWMVSFGITLIILTIFQPDHKLGALDIITVLNVYLIMNVWREMSRIVLRKP